MSIQLGYKYRSAQGRRRLGVRLRLSVTSPTEAKAAEDCTHFKTFGRDPALARTLAFWSACSPLPLFFLRLSLTDTVNATRCLGSSGVPPAIFVRKPTHSPAGTPALPDNQKLRSALTLSSCFSRTCS